jgi:DNA-binding HxlR family transcriptional regulator
MKGYGQFCPVAKAAEVVAERWTPLILRELLCGSHRFSELQNGLPLISRTLLSQRLRELEDAGVIRSVPKPSGRGRVYLLTEAGEELRPIIMELGEWGQRWTRELRREHLDAGLLMWDMQRRLDRDRLPAERTVVRFDFLNVPRHQLARRTWWLVLTPSDVDICLKDPGYDVDLCVTADLEAFVKVWMGDIRLTDAIGAGQVTLDGPRPWVLAFPAWLRLSMLARVKRPAKSGSRAATAA